MSNYSLFLDLFLGPGEGLEMGKALKVWWDFNDFISTSQIGGLGLWERTYAGAGAAIYPYSGTNLRPGILVFDTGTTNTGYAVLSVGGQYYPADFLFGAGTYTIESDIYISALSTATETYTIKFGFGDVYSGADFVDGAYFLYSDAGGGSPTPNWYKCTASNSTRTKTDTTIAAVAAAWTRLKIVVNADGTSVEYFINDVSAGVVTTNIPTGSGRVTGANLGIIKSAGTTAATIRSDWAWLHIDLTTSR